MKPLATFILLITLFSDANAVWQCPVGQYCSGGTVLGTCPSGYFSPRGDSGCTVAPLGYTTTADQGSVQLCSGGTLYSSNGICQSCPAGYQCSSNAAIKLCKPGNYGSSGTCYTCPANTICPSGGSTYGCSGVLSGNAFQSCSFSGVGCGSSGYYYDGSSCRVCERGYFCPSTSKSERYWCPSGYYTSSTQQTQCSNCPAGSSCSDQTASPVGCPGGSYSLDAYGYCITCPPGFACPYNYQIPGACSAGTYSYAGSTSCTACPAGYYCDKTYNAPMPCDEGYYCPGSTVNQIACSSGAYSAAQASSCTTCEAGYECSTKTSSGKTQCNSGKYSTGGAIVCTACPGGKPCLWNALGSVCPTGSYNWPSTYSPTSSTCYACTGAVICTSSFIGGTCGTGTYQPANTWSPSTSACSTCPAGYICPSTGMTSTIACTTPDYSLAGSTACTLCERNYKCPTPDQHIACTGGTSSNPGSTQCFGCPEGRWCDPRNPLTQGDCGAGTFAYTNSFYCLNPPPGYEPTADKRGIQLCDASVPFSLFSEGIACSSCPAGYQCNGPVFSICPFGTYSTGGASSCTQCPTNYICPDRVNLIPCAGEAAGSTKKFCTNDGSYTLLPNCNTGEYLSGSTCTDCLEGYFCPGFQFPQISCPAGTYNTAKNSQTCTICPAGSSCASASSSPSGCSNGQYSPQKSTSCITCPSGFYCASTTGNPVLCAPGTYSLGGQQSCSGCSAGYECPSVKSAGNTCDTGYYSAANYYACKNCPGGKLCDAASGVGSSCSLGSFVLPIQYASSCTSCTESQFCPAVDLPAYNCPSKTYSDNTASTCILCEAGSACPSSKKSDKITCSAGTYSMRGQTSCTNCPEGATCPGASSTRTLCAAGQYMDSGTNTCYDCEEGYACPTPQEANKHACDVGMISTTKATKCTNEGTDKIYYSRKATDYITCTGAGYYIQSGICNQMTYGKYWQSVYIVPVQCPPGYYTNSLTATTCTICPAGKSCPNVDGSGINDCAAGQYSEMGNYQGCIDCPIGFYCPSTTLPLKLQCSAGYYAPNTKMNACIICPANYRCDDKKVAVACGTNEYSLAGWAECRPCPAGYDCNNSPPTKCSAGQYSPEGVRSCSTCPSGYYCISGSARPVLCPAGKYQSLTGRSFCSSCSSGQYSREGATTCISCPAGYYCPVTYSVPLVCRIGYYSSGGLSSCLPCSAGYFCIQGSTSATPANSICPKGYYCPRVTLNGNDEVAMNPCPEGTYGLTEGYAAIGDCEPCPMGYFCPYRGMTMPKACPRGATCETTGLDTPNYCVAGYYNPNIGSTSAGACKACLLGNYCPGKTEDVYECYEGYYCPSGTTLPTSKCPAGKYSSLKAIGLSTSCLTCPKGSYCAIGSAVPTPCPPGTYNSITGKVDNTACLLCTAGTVCPKYGNIVANSGIPCPAGYYCPDGTSYSYQNPCPAGYYSDNTGNTQQTDCQSCPAGYSCTQGTNRFTNPMLICQPGFYCDANTISPTAHPCPGGYYYPYLGAQSENDCKKYDCPPGKYCPPGSSAPAGDCTNGYYCPQNTALATDNPCPAGYYSTKTGNRALSECVICPRGNYCGIHSVVGDITPCPKGTYNKVLGATDNSYCLTCEEGYYCDTVGLTNHKECGYGKYSGASAQICTVCDWGFYCNKINTKQSDLPSMFCAAGFLCPNGVSEYPHESLRCPAGAYCLSNSVYPITCPPGTYNPYPGGISSLSCIQTPAGYYSQRASVWPTGTCSPGYYCPAGSVRANQVPCPVGKFRSLDKGASESDCGECPAGYFCPLGCERPRECPKGFYCLASKEEPIKCPRGSFGGSPLLRSPSQCISCWGGRYCSQAGLMLPDGDCDPGFFCTNGATVPNPTDGTTGNVCPAGGYCIQGSAMAYPCSPGTFLDVSDGTGKSSPSDCRACTSGYYCIGEVRIGVSGICKAGYYCSQGSTVGAKTETDQASPPGYYSLARAGSPTPCDYGMYNPYYAQFICVNCPSGYYCQSQGTTEAPTRCPTGNYCGEKTRNPSGCAGGTYGPIQGLHYSTDCVKCTPGSYCYGGYAAPNGQCAAQFYCLLGSSNYQEAWCPPGKYCPTGTGKPLPCPSGTYYPYGNDGNALYAKSQCYACSGGYYCGTNGLSAVEGMCDSGYYCPSGVVNPRPKNYYCVEGQQCPAGSSGIQSCGAGYYQPSKKQGSCIKCPRGYYCPAGSTSFDSKNCPAGYYCLEGDSSSPRACPQGTYNTVINAFSSSHCIPCTPGYYCPGNPQSTFPTLLCAAGYYCIRGALTSSPSDGTTGYYCPTGTYCPAGTSYPIPCDPGKACTSTGLSAPNGNCAAGHYCPGGTKVVSPTSLASHNGDDCPAGYYCPANTAYPIPCPQGRYYSGEGLTQMSDCTICSNGYYCAHPGMTSMSGTCAQGFYCLKDGTMIHGHTTDRPYDHICPVGYYCPAGTSDKIICSGATYQERIGQGSCDQCPPGYWCDTSSKHYCTPNLEKDSYYCLGYSSTRDKTYCNDGYYNNQEGSKSASDCLACPRGKYCPYQPSAALEKINDCPEGYYCPGASGTSVNKPACSNGYYCPKGSADQIPCPPGYYCTGSPRSTVTGQCSAGYFCNGAASSATQNTCPKGAYCPAGSGFAITCPPGTYQPSTSQSTASACLPCIATDYCSTRGLNSPNSACPLGYYCPLGTAAGLSYPCPAGNRCPGNTQSPERCPDTTYQRLPGQGSCNTCPERFYCKNNNDDDAQNPKICPIGKYCAAGTLPVDCIAGTFNPREGMSKQAECEPCPPGKICSVSGLDMPDKSCTAGYFCRLGVDSDPPKTTANSGPCPIGYYCPTSTEVPIACPPGTINDLTKQTGLAACLPCPQGYHCPARGGSSSFYGITISSPTYKCAAGYLCLTGSAIPTPTDGVKGRKCSPGNYCGVGALTETPCAPGTYNPYEGQTSCYDCPPGKMCDQSGMIMYTNCPAGGYCPGKSAAPTPCPAGTYNPNLDIESVAQCYECDPGKYCLGGSNVVSGDCDPGYVCPRKSARKFSSTYYYFPLKTDGQCPPGYKCPAGSKAPVPCEVGTYQNQFGQSSCIDCPPGRYCAMTGISDPSLYKCAAGYICTGRAYTPTPTSDSEGGHLCSEGRYCVEGGTVEIKCPAGTYEPRIGSIACQPCPAGFYCDEGLYTPNICPANKYCPAATSVPITCPDGTFSFVSGLQSSIQCRPCTVGSYCKNGIVVGPCDQGYYCEGGAKEKNEAKFLCPIGHYCPQGCSIPSVCPEGKVRGELGGKTAADCYDCKEGFYCIMGSATPYACPKGHYCPSGSNQPTPCPKGYYLNDYQKIKLSDCIQCSIGYNCSEEGLGNVNNYLCPLGYYCSATGEVPKPCPNGTYSDVPGLYSKAQCKGCPEGFYCTEATVSPMICEEGTYCGANAYEPIDCPAKFYCQYTIYKERTISKRAKCPGSYYCPKKTTYPIKCENGYYCPEMSDTPTPCPSGTMGSNNPNNDNLVRGCKVCQPGYYSLLANSSAVANCTPCTPGYVCVLNTMTDKPVDANRDGGYECPKGYYCPEGSYAPTPCPIGTFNNKKIMVSYNACLPCDYNTYNDLQGQGGCKPCGPSSKSPLGSTTCICTGKNRVFQQSDGKCICGQMYLPVKEEDTEDSTSDCIPRVVPKCPNGAVRDNLGNCYSGCVGRKCPDGSYGQFIMGICQCETAKACNKSLSTGTNITVNNNGQVVVNGSDGYACVLEVSNKTAGEIKCITDGENCGFKLISMSMIGGFSASCYNPTGKELCGTGNRRRYLETNTTEETQTLTNPAICLNLDDSMSFAVSGIHYPVYLKDALANSNPNFDYSEFIKLDTRIKAGESISLFVFSFHQPGIYVFGDNADQNQQMIIAVMDKTQQCPGSDTILPINTENLLKLGVKQKTDLTLEPNWIFIGCCFGVILFIIPLMLALISYLHFKARDAKKLATIDYVKSKLPSGVFGHQEKGQSLSKTNRHDYSDDNLLKSSRTFIDIKGNSTNIPDEEAEVDPKIFDDIYAQLKAHSEFVKTEFEKKASIDKENIAKVWGFMRELKKAVKDKLKVIAKIFGKNVKFLFSKKKEDAAGKIEEKKMQEEKDREMEQNEAKNQAEEEESSEGDGNDMEGIIESIENKNAVDNKEFQIILEQEEGKLKEFMSGYIDHQSTKLEDFREQTLEMANISEEEKQKLLKDYESELQKLQQKLLLDQKEQQAILKMKLETKKNKRGTLANQLDSLKKQKRELQQMIITTISNMEKKRDKDFADIDSNCDKEISAILANLESKKRNDMTALRAHYDKQLKKANKSKERTNLLENFEKLCQEVDAKYENLKQTELKSLIDEKENERKTKKASVSAKCIEEIEAIKAHMKRQMDILNDQEVVIANKLGNVIIDEKIVETKDVDRAKADEDEARLQKHKEDYLADVQQLTLKEKEKLMQMKDERQKEEENMKEENEVQKRILASSIKKKSEDITKKKEKLNKMLNNRLLSEEEEKKIKDDLLKIDEELNARINEEIKKQDQALAEKLREKRTQRAIKEANAKASFAAQLSHKEQEYREEQKALRIEIRKQKLLRNIEDLKLRTREDEFPIAAEALIDDKHNEELAELLRKQYQEKAIKMSEQLGELIEEKIKNVKAIKEDTQNAYTKLKQSSESRDITTSDYERRLRDIQNRENDAIRDTELKFIQAQNDMEHKLSLELTQKHDTEIFALREAQAKEKKEMINGIVLGLSHLSSSTQQQLLSILVSSSAGLQQKEMQDFEDQLKQIRAKALKELDEKRNRLNTIAVENEGRIKQFNEETKRMLDVLARREKEKEEKRKQELEKQKMEFEENLRQKEGLEEAEKKKLLEEHAKEIERLNKAMEEEQKKQQEKMMAKLEKKIKEKEQYKAQKQIQLATYRRETAETMAQQLKETPMKLIGNNTKVEIKDKKSKLEKLIMRYDQMKTLYEKRKKLEGVTNIDQLESNNVGDRPKDEEDELEEITGALANVDFDFLYKKISNMDERIAFFTDEQFYKLLDGFRMINSTLNELRRRALERAKKYM